MVYAVNALDSMLIFSPLRRVLDPDRDISVAVLILILRMWRDGAQRGGGEAAGDSSHVWRREQRLTEHDESAQVSLRSAAAHFGACTTSLLSSTSMSVYISVTTQAAQNQHRYVSMCFAMKQNFTWIP